MGGEALGVHRPELHVLAGVQGRKWCSQAGQSSQAWGRDGFKLGQRSMGISAKCSARTSWNKTEANIPSN